MKDYEYQEVCDRFAWFVRQETASNVTMDLDSHVWDHTKYHVYIGAVRFTDQDEVLKKYARSFARMFPHTTTVSHGECIDFPGVRQFVSITYGIPIRLTVEYSIGCKETNWQPGLIMYLDCFMTKL